MRNSSLVDFNCQVGVPEAQYHHVTMSLSDCRLSDGPWPRQWVLQILEELQQLSVRKNSFIYNIVSWFQDFWVVIGRG